VKLNLSWIKTACEGKAENWFKHIKVSINKTLAFRVCKNHFQQRKTNKSKFAMRIKHN